MKTKRMSNIKLRRLAQSHMAKKDLRAPTLSESQDAPNQSLSRNRNRMEVFFQVITLKRLRSAGVLDSRPRGMLGFNRLLVMLEPVTTLSDDDHQVPAAKSTAKAKSKAPTPKSSPKRPSPPETVLSPKQKAKAKAKSSSSHPPMKRPSVLRLSQRLLPRQLLPLLLHLPQKRV